jgi:hypothetical protein
MVPLLWSLYLWYLFDATGHTLQMVVNLERLHLSFGRFRFFKFNYFNDWFISNMLNVNANRKRAYNFFIT